jgi:phosphatidylglycerophosphatase A
LAVYFAYRGIAYFGHDGRPIVIDEMIGQMVALFMAPHNIAAYVLSFLLFRGFDIIKPQPAKAWEKLRGGYGIVADDIAAGFYAAVALHLIIIVLRRLGAMWI